jgi:hypothetical protein
MAMGKRKARQEPQVGSPAESQDQDLLNVDNSKMLCALRSDTPAVVLPKSK